MAEIPVLPVSAGIIRTGRRVLCIPPRAPCIRGDDPDKTMGFIIRNRCSPYPRG